MNNHCFVDVLNAIKIPSIEVTLFTSKEEDPSGLVQ